MGAGAETDGARGGRRALPDAPTEVVAALLTGSRLADEARRAWDAGRAILPLDPAAPPTVLARALAHLRPTVVVDVDGRHDRPDGTGAAAGVAAVIATSGTTGEPKGVELTRAGMEVMGRGYTAAVGASTSDRWLACLPLHHVASLAVLARSYVAGVPCVVHDGFDLARVAAAPREEAATIVSLVPTALRRLLDAGAPLAQYRCIVVGGAPCPAALRDRAEAAGARVVDAYGMTETWGGWVIDGVPIAGAEPSLAPDGELLVRGEVVMHGYRLDPARTTAAFTPDGRLRTGDLAEITGGRVRVLDRKTDLVITGGVNVQPAEVEAVLARHPDVADVAIAGAPDPEWGERVVAFVVPSIASAPPTIDALRAFARGHLAAAKLPREVRVVAEIPRTEGGKLDRRALTDR